MSRRRSNATSCRVATPGKICCFCGLCDDNEIEYGKIYELGNIVTHYYCLLLSSMMQQRGRDDQGILGFLSADIEKEVRRGKRLVCYHCKKNGATLGCCNTKCKRIFHLPCGLKAGSLHQFYSEFRSYCINHRPKQLIDGRVLEEVQNSETTLCYICYDNVNYRDILAMLWAPCCKKNAFFHRTCVQQLANSSGYFFKCPLCNNKKEFQEAMLEHGIFIPSQDASWELVPNAFQELLYRHNQCDAETCVCPKGRNHSSSNAKWELVLCRMCGSQGVHRHCGHLKWANSSWECHECQSILDKSSLVNRQIQSDDAEGNAGEANSKEVDSDSDLSVGQDSTEQTERNDALGGGHIPIVRVRPGPLSYKMKEVMKVAQSQPKTKGSSSSLEGTNSSSSLPESENGNKNVKDPKPVILLDSDEEPDVIEIISEKVNPKVLTTNDGKKIEILDKRAIDELSKNGEPTKLEARKLPTPQKESKPTITSIQTVNPSLIPKTASQLANMKAFSLQSSVHSRITENAVPQILQNMSQQRPRIVCQQLANPGNASQEFNESLSPQLSNFKAGFSGPRFNAPIPRPSPPNLNQRPPTPQNFNPRSVTPQIFHLRSIGPQGLSPINLAQVTQSKNPAPLTTISKGMQLSSPPHLTPIKRYTGPTNQTNSAFQMSSGLQNFGNQSIPGNQITPEKQVAGRRNKAQKTPVNYYFGNSTPASEKYFSPAKISMNEDDSLGIKILDVCSLAPDLFDKLDSHDSDSMNLPDAFKSDSSAEMGLKRKAEVPGPSQILDQQTSDLKRSRVSDEGLFTIPRNEIVTDRRENVKEKSSILRNLMEEAMVNANITQSDLVSGNDDDQPSTSNVQARINNFVMPTYFVERGKSQDVVKVPGSNGACQRDAVINAAFSQKHGLSAIKSTNKVGSEAENQFTAKADAQFGNDSLEESKFSNLCCSNSETCHELSENSSSCDSTGLIPDNVSLSDVKFRVCGSDIVQVILYDKYRIDIKMDNSGSRSPRDSDSSPLPCPSLIDDFDDSQDPDDEMPRKRIRDFEFEENTLQEFPATSRMTAAIAVNSALCEITSRERLTKAAKENLDPVKLTVDEKIITSSPFVPNDLRILHHRRSSGNARTNAVSDACLNCKVSIDLKKIWELVESQPHLFSKYDKSLCKYKTHEVKLTDVCKLKNKWLLMKSQSQDGFYGVSTTRSRLLFKSKSMEDLTIKETGLSNKEEIKTHPVTKINLRRGLKRKCKYSMPIR